MLVHAAPGDLWRAPAADAEDGELSATHGSLDASTVVYGHIHRPYTRTSTELTVANSGSVGMSWDGDPSACYLLVENAHARLVRVDYDVEREVALLLASGYPDAVCVARTRIVAPHRWRSPWASHRDVELLGANGFLPS